MLRSHIYYKHSFYSLLPFILLLMLSGCGPNLFPQVIMHPGSRSEQAIVSPFQPFRVVQVCLDTPPLFPSGYFHQAAVAIAARLDALVMPNQGGLTAYVSLIEHDSLQTSVLTITVPPIPADPPRPQLLPLPNSALFSSPYDYAQALDAVKKSNADFLANWQAQLKSNHDLLSRTRTLVKKETDRLRALAAPVDSIGADIWGCLDLASQHFQHEHGLKSLVIASPLINNTALQVANVDLSGASVTVIYRNCVIESICLANDSYWKRIFLSSHARSVNFYDPAQSQALLPVF